MRTPDVTPAQIVGIAQAVLGVALAFALPISNEQSIAILALVAVIASVLFGADAKIRTARAENADRLAEHTPDVRA